MINQICEIFVPFCLRLIEDSDWAVPQQLCLVHMFNIEHHTCVKHALDADPPAAEFAEGSRLFHH